MTLSKLPENITIYLYGKGYMGETYLTLINILREDINIIFIDDYTTNKNDITFNTFEKQHKKNFYIINCIITQNTRELIDLKIINSGYKNNLIEIEGINGFLKSETFPLSYMILEDFYYKNKSIINKNIKSLDSSQDKKLYKDLINYKYLDLKKQEQLINGVFFNKFGDYNEELHYCEYLNDKFIDTIIAGGIFDGLSSKKIKARYLNTEGKIYGFDPMIHSYITEQNIIDMKNNNIYLVDTCLWNKVEKINFLKNGSSSKIINNSDFTVNATTIDMFRDKNNLKIDMIKLDIEGAESNAIDGAIKTINEDRPQLAISIYHSNEDMVFLFSKIVSLTKEYIYKIGHYNEFIHETVLYAIPKEKIKKVK